jgi:hypothetical protein
MKPTINDGLRTMGQLLLAHPTTGLLARDRDGREAYPTESQASCFCFIGAAMAAENALNLQRPRSLLGQVLDRAAAKLLDVEYYNTADNWDSASDEGRRDMALALCSIEAP